jgi:hypothetical protein
MHCKETVEVHGAAPNQLFICQWEIWFRKTTKRRLRERPLGKPERRALFTC